MKYVEMGSGAFNDLMVRGSGQHMKNEFGKVKKFLRFYEEQ